jgi:hypothetical protein
VPRVECEDAGSESDRRCRYVADPEVRGLRALHDGVDQGGWSGDCQDARKIRVRNAQTVESG